MRVDIPRKTRIVDTNADTNESRIHSVEIADDFITIYGKDSIPEIWNRGVKHNPHKFHAEHEQNLWITDQFPGKDLHGWAQHIHVMVDHPQLSDFDDFWPFMSDGLAAEIREFFGSE